MESVGITTHRPLAGYDGYLTGVSIQHHEKGAEGKGGIKKTWNYRIPANVAQEALRQFSEEPCSNEEALEWIGKLKDGLRTKKGAGAREVV